MLNWLMFTSLNFNSTLYYIYRYFIYFKEFGSYNKQIRLVKSRSNSRGSILDDFLLSQSGGNRNIPSSLNLTLSAVLGNTDYESVLGSTPHLSLFQECHKIHESTCTYNSHLALS